MARSHGPSYTGSGSMLTGSFWGFMEAYECEHAELLEAGTNRGTAFFRCAACQALLVIQRDRVWVLRPRAGS